MIDGLRNDYSFLRRLERLKLKYMQNSLEDLSNKPNYRMIINISKWIMDVETEIHQKELWEEFETSYRKGLNNETR